MWGEAILASVYLLNRSPCAAITEKKTPAELWFTSKPDVSKLRVFGSRCYYWVPNQKRKKMDPKSNEAVMVGYAPNGYRLWDSNLKRVIEARDVKFLENSAALPLDFQKDDSILEEYPGRTSEERVSAGKYNLRSTTVKSPIALFPFSRDTSEVTQSLDTEGAGDETVEGDDPDDELSTKSTESQAQEGDETLDNDLLTEDESTMIDLESSLQDEANNSTALPPHIYEVSSVPDENLGSSGEERTLTGKLKELVGNFVSLSFIEEFYSHVPKNFNEIEKLPNHKDWMKAVKDEIASLKKNETWEVVSRPTGVKLIDTKWIFKIKQNDMGQKEKYKARLVARGFMQKEHVDYEATYAPVAKLATIRILLAVCLKKNYVLHQMDVKTAFLNGVLTEDVYMKPPDGFQIPDGHVCKLKKSLYGLKQSPRCWNQRFHDFVTKLGFVRSKYDYCLYTRTKDGDVEYLVLYVDDILIGAKDEDAVISLKRKFKKEFEMTDVGPVKDFLGMEINYDRTGGKLELSQVGAIEKLLEKFQMAECRSVKTPMQHDLLLSPTKNRKPLNRPYRELIGSLMYIMLATRPDLCFVIAYLSRFQDKYDDTHWNALKYVLRYVKGTKDFKLVYKRSTNESPLTGYVDSDFARDLDRKSTTGYIFEIYGSSVVWCSRKQQMVTVSSTEAEYVAASLAVCEALWLRGILTDLEIKPLEPTILYEDNQSCIKVANNQESKKLKHIDVRYHHVRDNIDKRTIELKYVPSADQKADLMTKPLPTVQFEKLVKSIGLKNTSIGNSTRGGVGVGLD